MKLFDIEKTDAAVLMSTQKRLFKELPTCKSICTIYIFLTQLGHFDGEKDALDSCRGIKNADQAHV